MDVLEWHWPEGALLRVMPGLVVVEIVVVGVVVEFVVDVGAIVVEGVVSVPPTIAAATTTVA